MTGIKRFVAFVDHKDGVSREDWNVFYTPFFVADSAAKATAKARAHIADRRAKELAEDGELSYTAHLIMHVRQESEGT